MTYNLLHIADPHFSRCHYTSEYDPAMTGREHAIEVVDALKKSGHSSNLNAIVISGDFTFGYNPSGFVSAVEFLQTLSEELKPAEILVIPGNHDVDVGGNSVSLGKLSLPTTKEAAEYQFRSFLKQVPLQRHEPNWYLSTALRSGGPVGTGLILLGINSCRVERRDAQGWGYIGADQIYNAVKTMLTGGAKKGDIVLVFVHHNLLPIWDVGLEQTTFRPENRKFSFTIDAASALSELSNLGVSAIFHGHTHVRSTKRVAGYGNDIEAKNFSYLIGSASFGLYDRNCLPHHFQLIEITTDEIEIFNFTSSYHLRNDKREWDLELPDKLFPVQSWDPQKARLVLTEILPRRESAKADYEIMKSWAVLRDHPDAELWPQTLLAIHRRITKIRPISINAISELIDSLFESPPDELDLCKFSLEEYILLNLGNTE